MFAGEEHIIDKYVDDHWPVKQAETQRGRNSLAQFEIKKIMLSNVLLEHLYFLGLGHRKACDGYQCWRSLVHL